MTNKRGIKKKKETQKTIIIFITEILLHSYRCGHAAAPWRWYLAPAWATSYAATCRIASQIRTCFRGTRSGLLKPGWTRTRKSTTEGTRLLISSDRCLCVCVCACVSQHIWSRDCLVSVHHRQKNETFFLCPV